MNQRRVTDSPWLFPIGALVLALVFGAAWMLLRPESPVAANPEPSPSGTAQQATATFAVDLVPNEPHRVARIDVLRNDATLTVASTVETDDTPPTATSTVSPTAETATCAMPVSVCWAGTAANLSLAVIPGRADDLTSVPSGLAQRQYLRAVDVTAVVVVTGSDTATSAFIWTDADGRLRDSEASQPTSARVSAGGHTVTIFEDSELHVWGFFDRANELWMSAPIASEPIGELRAIMEVAEGKTSTATSWLGVLPTGATDPEIEADSGVVWSSAPIGATGRIAIAAFADTVPAARIHRVSYTDASGVRRTFKP